MELTLASIPALRDWLVSTPHVNDGGVTFTHDLVATLRERGAPLWRCSLCLLTKHPEVFWRNVQWSEAGGVKVFERLHETLDTPFFLKSPIAALRAGAPSIRVPLVAGDLPFPICGDLRDQGATDYYTQGLRFSSGETSYASWATRDPLGFTDGTLAALDALLPALTQRVELESAYHGTRALLDVYLGHNASRRVLDGAFRRGGGERIEAAIWFCDLRDFTAMSDRLPAEEVVAILDAYFDCVAGAIAARGGEVLKFIGDAVLGIFPVGGNPARACREALSAATESLAALAELNREREASRGEPLSIGVALHLGSVMYGNIGSRRRLDFTVISSSVNEACRLEGLCKSLGTPLTLSETFVGALQGESVVDLGSHALKGVTAPIRVFTIEAHRPRSSSVE